MIKISKIYTELVRIFLLIPRYQNKRYKNRRSIGMGLFQCSNIVLKYGMQA